ncbi:MULTISPECIES: acetyl-CoA carboxylase biotin carboxylase subunit [unclassified Breznakia]|uniref:acetyl-CoA carboxylase biotin carboxylase subunit n=1 Tax=unclassified Breznakia TaxID=2623764 RepID=UPI0024743979|nr:MULTISPECIES: acetyl-CoA carboxylase biotin carboxylase subunit [unclassified Breznakia]MDH6365868.1 acetyl-CoA carboxylase biotin carboxylase subunit [Breznakia sp. PH1-1]MDH6403200.1 acetyl-CoA carboxylase biotin carboxylase subunit [Breznakia sp. PF1-11]MDH6410909.1 acetyl-CoA carboxylase biotin carboxylase subunit [Breznakia sp. PFB1-11]MDH6413034.1 acetyl-CoA carboxylase biotin carboxylase subunit [Breznakia sp. PFB1-14]MDH6415402.1 acetyl-CoA carboxylase biotin carboxylase subunit [Br
MIQKLCIANRGEIAVRIIRACKEMGIQSVALYSTADKDALHTQLADEAICIGGPRVNESYLDMNNIIQAACSTGCDAIHPGFGFLSENPKFARLVQSCGLIFVGPDPEIIEKMGNKSKARQMMMEANVPVIPGSKQILADAQEGLALAKSMGFPVIIKASSGGGGRGMRIVRDEDTYVANFKAAKAEAMACFGDDDVYMEKYLENPKHIEVQLLADKHGNVIHLFERDCSFQRRNQKMIEEAPCHILDDTTRQEMLDAAVRAAKYVGYNSVGTIEFLLDKNNHFYFMEMNTRVQVEHPISEMITGVDIIKEQIRSADGIVLKYKQADIVSQGYALECRINAENIAHDFAPSPGKINFLHIPGGKGVRSDSAVYCGYEIPPYYDSMILKLITFAPTRLACIKKMRSALSELIIDGVHTNIEFHYLVLHAPKFVEGKYDTGFAESYIKELVANGEFI